MTGDKIKQLRTSLGWTQRQLALYLCSNVDWISKMEQPEYRAEGPILKLLELLARMGKETAIINTEKLTGKPKSYYADMLATTRRMKRMTQAAFGKLLGVKWQYVSNLETGVREITPRLCRLVSMVKK